MLTGPNINCQIINLFNLLHSIDLAEYYESFLSHGVDNIGQLVCMVIQTPQQFASFLQSVGIIDRLHIQLLIHALLMPSQPTGSPNSRPTQFVLDPATLDHVYTPMTIVQNGPVLSYPWGEHLPNKAMSFCQCQQPLYQRPLAQLCPTFTVSPIHQNNNNNVILTSTPTPPYCPTSFCSACSRASLPPTRSPNQPSTVEPSITFKARSECVTESAVANGNKSDLDLSQLDPSPSPMTSCDEVTSSTCSSPMTFSSTTTSSSSSKFDNNNECDDDGDNPVSPTMHDDSRLGRGDLVKMKAAVDAFLLHLPKLPYRPASIKPDRLEKELAEILTLPHNDPRRVEGILQHAIIFGFPVGATSGSSPTRRSSKFKLRLHQVYVNQLTGMLVQRRESLVTHRNYLTRIAFELVNVINYAMQLDENYQVVWRILDQQFWNSLEDDYEDVIEFSENSPLGQSKPTSEKVIHESLESITKQLSDASSSEHKIRQRLSTMTRNQSDECKELKKELDERSTPHFYSLLRRLTKQLVTTMCKNKGINVPKNKKF